MGIRTALVVCMVLASSAAAGAQSSPAPQPTASPRVLGLSEQTSAGFTFIDQATAGGGQTPPEAGGFINGSPLAPNTPYDLFSSAPLVPGLDGIADLRTDAAYRLKKFDLSALAGFELVDGSVTNASYWGESLMPTVNPHLGSRLLPYAVEFPTRPGQDDAGAASLALLSGKVGTADGNVTVTGGWFDLVQTERFVFAQPALTSVNPAIAYAPAESLAPSVAGGDVWQPNSSALPLHGVDVVGKRGLATLELSTAALPSLPGDDVRATIGSLVVDHGEGTRYAFEALHVKSSGTPFLVTVPFGTDPVFGSYPTGILPTSYLSGQEQTILGASAAVHVVQRLGIDAVGDVGRAWYDAAPVARPGTQAPGGYYRAGLARKRGRTSATLDFLRMEPRYATMILPYGAPENQWSPAFAWPGQWLKSTYQLVDNTALGVNRQGYRLRYYVDGGALEVRGEYTDLRQIDPETRATSTQNGFVDGFYLPQFDDHATLGRQRRYAAWLAYHASIGDFTLDVVDDTLYRPFDASHPEDAVSYEVPQAVLGFARHLSPDVLFSTGVGRYALKGAFSEPIDFAERFAYAGVVVKQTKATSLLLSLRRQVFGGITTFPASSRSPDFTGSTIVLEQRAQL